MRAELEYSCDRERISVTLFDQNGSWEGTEILRRSDKPLQRLCDRARFVAQQKASLKGAKLTEISFIKGGSL